MNAQILSQKGKDWNGNPLNEDNVFGGSLVMFKGEIYSAGNRYHDEIELYRGGKFKRTARGKDIQLVAIGEAEMQHDKEKLLIDELQNKIYLLHYKCETLKEYKDKIAELIK